MNSKDRKGVVARVWSWVQSFWLQPDGNTCQEYVFIAVVTLVFAFLFAAPPANPAATAGPLLLALRRVLLRIAFEECHCGSKSQCHCHVWLARAVLDEDCPGAIETEIRERLGEYRDENDGRWVLNNLPFSDTQGPLPKDLDLAAYLYPAELEWHRANGQLPEAHQASPQ